MSGLYNVLFGVNPAADLILAAVGIARADAGRFRDAFVASGEIVVYTRNGGGNREPLAHVFDALRRHPLYLRDADDSHDSTYASIFFRLPAGAEKLRDLDIGQWDPDARWKAKFARLEAGDTTDPGIRRAFEMGRRMFAGMDGGSGGTIAVGYDENTGAGTVDVHPADENDQ